MKQKIICIIQARFNSTRLPGKVLFDLEGKTVLERVVERVSGSSLIDKIIVATTLCEEDSKITRLCSAKGIDTYRGSEEDVLDRYYQAAKLMDAYNIVRITADCPLIDPKIIDKVIKTHLESKADYTSNILKETFPDGQDIEIFNFQALEKAWKNAKLTSEREHVTPFIRNNPGLFKLVNVENKEDLSSQRWTLDENRDYELIKSVYGYFNKKKIDFGMKDILKFIRKHPELEAINAAIARNEGYVKSLKEDKLS
jgi:spore coat polysaccharide biosynthesis protein SpsF (cytidylyltransferase family)